MSDQGPGKRLGPAALLVGALLSGPAGAASIALLPPVVGASELYGADPLSGLALRGFDPVTYHLPGGPRSGRAELETLWRGVAWRFESEANRQAFLANPEAFAPRVGGRDPVRAAEGAAVDAAPEIYLVLDERLYLFRTDANRTAFAADPDLRRRAEEGWQGLKGTLVQP